MGKPLSKPDQLDIQPLHNPPHTIRWEKPGIEFPGDTGYRVEDQFVSRGKSWSEFKHHLLLWPQDRHRERVCVSAFGRKEQEVLHFHCRSKVTEWIDMSSEKARVYKVGVGRH